MLASWMTCLSSVKGTVVHAMPEAVRTDTCQARAGAPRALESETQPGRPKGQAQR